jgi:hypothetical protein
MWIVQTNIIIKTQREREKEHDKEEKKSGKTIEIENVCFQLV